MSEATPGSDYELTRARQERDYFRDEVSRLKNDVAQLNLKIEGLTTPSVPAPDGATGRPKVFLVQGNCGEYSDYREWVICAYESEKDAQEHALKAKQWLQENVSYETTYHERDKLKNPFDGEFYGTDPQTDWTAYGVYLICDPSRDAAREKAMGEMRKALEETTAEAREHRKNIIEAREAGSQGIDDKKYQDAYDQEIARFDALIERANAALASAKQAGV